VQKVENHLDGCRRCTAMYLELNEVNSSLAALLGPLVLGAAASGYLAAAGTGGVSAGGVLALLDRGKDLVLANVQAAAAVGATIGVAGVATIAVALSNGTSTPTASPPRPAVTGPLSQPPSSTPAPEPKKKKRPATVRTTSAPAVVVPSATPTEAEPTQAPADEPNDAKPKPQPAAPVPTVVAPVVSDVGVRLTFSLRVGVLTPQRDGLLGFLSAGVTGVPAGERATLTVRVVGGRLVARGPGCRTAGSTATCDIGPGATPQFNVMGVPVSASASVAVGGFTDPVTTNNNDSVLLGLLRLGSLRK
jgi:hypothetical protein